MNKVTTLPIDLGQPSEFKGDNSIGSTASAERGDNFSQVLAQNSPENLRGNKAAKSVAEKSDNVQDVNNSSENDITNKDEKAQSLQENQTTKNTENQKVEAETSEQLNENIQDKLLSGENESDKNAEQAQTEQLLQLLQNSDQTLIENKVVEQQANTVTADNIKQAQEIKQSVAQAVIQDDEINKQTLAQASLVTESKQGVNKQESNSATVVLDDSLQQAKMLTPKTGEILDPKTGKNWKGKIELPIDPPVVVQKSQVSLDTASLVSDKAMANAEQAQGVDDETLTAKLVALAQDKQGVLKANDNDIALNATNKEASKEGKVANSDSAKREDSQYAKIAQTLTSVDNVKNLQGEALTLEGDNKAKVLPFALNQGANNETKNASDKLTDSLAAVVKGDEESTEASEQAVIDHITKKELKPTEVKGDQQIYSTLTTQANTSTNHYSEADIQDIQTLQAISDKVIEINTQNQKIELIKQAETIAIYKKDFINNLQDKVMVMVQQKLQQVDIRLDPPELGKMQVRLHLHNDQATVQFTVQNQQAKESLEQNMPRLREMLAEQGVNVGDANVGQQGEKGFMGAGEQGHSNHVDNAGEDEYLDASQVFTGKVVKGSATGIDYYA